MKRLAPVLIIALMLSLSVSSFATDVPDLPAGVEAKNWIAINERIGLVLVERHGGGVVASGPQALLLRPPVDGYFMIRGAAGWTRLVIVEPTSGPGGAG